jgi:type IV pilus assembly protein PilY1
MRRPTIMILASFIWFFYLFGAGRAADPTIADYTAYPSFIVNAVPPNIMIILDNSASMKEPAYGMHEDLYHHADTFGAVVGGVAEDGSDTTLIDSQGKFLNALSELVDGSGDVAAGVTLTLRNVDDGSTGTITHVTATTLTVAGGMSGGTDNANEAGDSYWIGDSTLTDPRQKGQGYYGYFATTDSTYNNGQGRPAKYRYESNVFVRDDANGQWSGTFLNWLSMRKVDVARKVLVGGKATSRTGTGDQHLIGHSTSTTYMKFSNNQSGQSPYGDNRAFYRMKDGYIEVYELDDGQPDLDFSYDYRMDSVKWSEGAVNHKIIYEDWNSPDTFTILGKHPIASDFSATGVGMDYTNPKGLAYVIYDADQNFTAEGVQSGDRVYDFAYAEPEAECPGSHAYGCDSEGYEFTRVKAVPATVNEVLQAFDDSNTTKAILYDLLHQGPGNFSGNDGYLDGDHLVCQASGSYSDCWNHVSSNPDELQFLADHLVVFTNYFSGTSNQFYNGRDYGIFRETHATFQERLQIEADRDMSNPDEASDFVDGNIAGVIQKIGNQARFGLEFFYTDGWDGGEGGEVVQPIGGTITNIVTAIENFEPDGNTPLAESLFTALRYFAQHDMKSYYGHTEYSVNNSWDPYYINNTLVECNKSFVLQITDGEANVDNLLPDTWLDGLPSDPDYTLKDYDDDGHDDLDDDGRDWLDDVALYGNINDFREDIDGMQNITYYGVFAFGQGADNIKQAAKNGGFDEIDGVRGPTMQEEWDKDADGVPDTYLEAQNANQLENKIYLAINDMLKKAATATSVAVLSTSERGEGTVYQAYFLPLEPQGLEMEDVEWTGYLQALWVDEWGNLREDTDGDHALTVRCASWPCTANDVDLVVRYRFDSGSLQTYLDRFLDADGDGDILDDNTLDANGDPVPLNSVPLKGTHSIFEVGRKLAETSAANRRIFTFADADLDGVCDNCGAIASPTTFSKGETKSLTTDQLSAFQDYLDVVGDDDASYAYLGEHTGDDAETAEERATKLVNYIRGTDQAGLRSRTMLVGGSFETWKLGDIVRSTPTVVQEPMGSYHLSMGDQDYLAFLQQYKDREGIIYVGANDGMLHAIRAGRYVSGDNPDTENVKEAGYIVPPATGTLGSEAWAFVPFNLLPHLKWLPDPGYTHVYYVDQKVKVLDVNIFSDDAVHPGGWGTLLIGAMRLGGKGYPLDGHTTRSAYFFLDITEPEAPVVLGEFTHDDLALTTSFPSVVRTGNKWYMVAGSGPTEYEGRSEQQQEGSIFVLDLNALVSGSISYRRLQTGDTSAYLADPINIDTDANGVAEAVYIPETFCDQKCDPITNETRWNSKIWRLSTQRNSDPNAWTLGTLFTSDQYQAMSAAPVASLGYSRELWLYFGTGRFYGWTDKFNTQTQSLYGVHDACPDGGCAGLTSADLVNVTNESITTDSAGKTRVEQLQTNITNGWQLNLDTKERSLNKPTIIGGTALFTTYLPDEDPCALGGNGRLYALNFRTGTAYYKPILDEAVSGDVSGTYVDTGYGMPSGVAIHMNMSGVSALIQNTTAEIKHIDPNPIISPWSGMTTWHQF